METKNRMGRKGDLATDTSKRRRITKWIKLTTCDVCGEKAVDRHHIDGNPGNNVRENITCLCRRCHMVMDGRLNFLVKCIKRKESQRKKCDNCGEVVKVTRKGLCHKCNEYKRRNGDERPCFVSYARITKGQERCVLSLREKGYSLRGISKLTDLCTTTILRVIRHKEEHK